MGFGDGLLRFVQGKPIFEPQDVSKRESERLGADPQPVSKKSIPSLTASDVRCRLHSNKLEVYCTIRNDSNDELEIDKAMVFGVRHETDFILKPGQSKQELIYSGPELRDERPGMAIIQYKKTSDGDYFSMEHIVRLRKESDGTFTPTEMKPFNGVRDIFE